MKIPYFYGEAVYNVSPTLFFISDRYNYFIRACTRQLSKSKNDALEQPAKALKALTSYGVKYIDAKWDNCLVANYRQVMIVNFEQVESHTTGVWEESTNHRSVGPLTRDFIGSREPK